MANTQDIRRRIKSIRNTAQITKAMQMVAASKMRKAQVAALAGRPYAALMNKVLAQVVAGAGDFKHAFLENRGGTKRNLAAEFTYKDAPLFGEARAISKFAQELFLKGDVDAVDILYTNFVST